MLRGWHRAAVGSGRRLSASRRFTPPPRPAKTQDPHAVLGVQRHATRDQIREQFRSRAKRLHPDLNPAADAGLKMSELVAAYDLLMEDDFGGRMGDSRVASSVELFGLAELRAGGLHGVHRIKVLFDGALLPRGVEQEPEQEQEQEQGGGRELVVSRGGREPTHLVRAAGHHSVSDLKRQLEEEHAAAWGLEGRRRGREGTLLGWELVQEDGLLESGELGTVVLSYHLFLQDYGVSSGDVLFAVVRLNE